ncbi:bifunctional nuclease family protein [Geomobilimonas luticola]|uniref:Bifunctional nuclease family protein n=1 Tax=Geomobilimonas luticola TaxID=1114878 RepID=A0ABS5SFL3_9BACT|nr:bifunctional nuclease family protein [Geomobilimonas luticola]MBT0654158.1 bifunctional nuclease family protein [Geomobilimonas luticola]
MYHEMTIHGFTLDSLAHRPVVILKDSRNRNTVPIWLNSNEAVAMAAEIVGRDLASQRSGGDLLMGLMEKLSMQICQVAIEGVQDGIYRASVRFRLDGEEIRVDVRPSEAFLTSLKYKLPVHVADEVVQQASRLTDGDDEMAQETAASRFADFLENLDPAVMGKYPM